MPIKLPKGFQRRKSSGNVLDEQPNGEPQSSFRVIPRPGSSGAALDALEVPKFPQDTYRNSFEEDSEELFTVARPDVANRGSGGTNNSMSTAPYDSAASSRMSTSSTNPSSVDTKSDNNTKNAAAAGYNDIPVPPSHSQRGGFLRNAGRMMAGRKSSEVTDLPPTNKTPASSVRDRSMTVSSVTTATPPRLDDTNISINNTEDSFGSMFDTIGAKSNRDRSPTRAPDYLASSAGPMRGGPLRATRAGAVPALSGDMFDSSPYSQGSRDELMRSPSPSRTVTQNSPGFSTIRNIPSHVESEEDNMFVDTNVRGAAKAPSVRSPPSSFPSMAMRSRGYSAATSTIRSPISERSSLEVPGLDPALVANADLASRYHNARPAAAANSKVMTPAQFERYKQQKEETRKYNKVFGKEDSDDSGDDYEDDEEDEKELEREKNATNARKKQEAHLAVYRQQMMKVTGERPTSQAEERPSSSQSNHIETLSSTLEMPKTARLSSTMDMPTTSRFSTTIDMPSASRPLSTFDRPNASARTQSMLDIPSMTNHMSHITVDGKRSSSGGKSSQGEEEDEDVPLGILAAHGFPSKNRPPSKLMGTSSNPNLRGSAHLDAARPGNRASRLPAFAQRLPSDPYYGASIVQPSYRENMMMNRESQAMQSTPNIIPPQPSGAATQHPLHPAGLVGVIAGEERARAMRRGSPNTPGTFDLPPGIQASHPGVQRAQTMGNLQVPGMHGLMPPMPGMPQMTANDQAQIQMSQQMNQMMQLQMQWMQFMTSTMGQQSPPGMPQEMMSPQGMPPAASQAAMSQYGRPQSVPLQAYPGQGQRTMSTLTPSMANWAHHSSPAVPQVGQMMNSQYAPSIAPSERSNIGMASRYRPVSTIQQDPEPAWQKRSSTFTSSTMRPWSHVDTSSKATPARPVGRPVSTILDDEDDEQGWAEMAAKKEQKKRKWKLRKTQTDTTLQELYNA